MIAHATSCARAFLSVCAAPSPAASSLKPEADAKLSEGKGTASGATASSNKAASHADGKAAAAAPLSPPTPDHKSTPVPSAAAARATSNTASTDLSPSAAGAKPKSAGAKKAPGNAVGSAGGRAQGAASGSKSKAAKGQQGEEEPQDDGEGLYPETPTAEHAFEVRRRRAALAAVMTLLEEGASSEAELARLTAPMSETELMQVCEKGGGLCQHLHLLRSLGH